MSKRIPPNLKFSRKHHDEARETSRWLVESKMIKEKCSGYNPEFKGINNEIKGIDYVIQIDSEIDTHIDNVTLRMVIPEDYPSSLPQVYPLDLIIPFDHRAHVYRNSPANGRKVHLCMVTQEEWTRDCSIAGLMVLSAIWVHKYLIWRKTGEWPGRGRTHCNRCGNIGKCDC